MSLDAGPDDVTAAMAGPAFRDDPYPLYARMRRECPVQLGAQRIWRLTRHRDVEAALVDPRLSSDRVRMADAMTARGADFATVGRLMRRLGRVMSNTDPPEHARLRTLVNRGFTARRVEGLRTEIQLYVDALVDRMIDDGPGADLVAALAAPLPATVVCALFGIPATDRDRVQAWFRDLGRLAEDQEQAEAAVEQFEGYLADLVERRRADPGDDMISALVSVQAASDGTDRLSDDELLSTCFMLVTAGGETTTNLVANGTLALLEHPAQWSALCADPTLARAAVEEAARFDSPTQTIIRVVAEPVVLDGHRLEPGDIVHLVLAAADRDPEQFDDPDRFTVGRAQGRSLAFGAGRHFCLGAPLARLETELALATLARRLPGLRPVGGPPARRPNPLMRRLASLPVTW